MSRVKGIDTATPLTAATVSAVKAAGYAFAGRYLVPASGTLKRKALTAPEAKLITDVGLRLLTVWETSADRVPGGASAGAADGAQAYTCAKAIDMPSDGIIYFAVDYEATDAQVDTIAAYLQAQRICRQRGHRQRSTKSAFTALTASWKLWPPMACARASGSALHGLTARKAML
ncbi:MAG: DUF1906 domain-containing protein [Oscillospiraceae bacterium]|nr:DUF1906 domain-containing protein [Oscillospiraceae bacterium]